MKPGNYQNAAERTSKTADVEGCRDVHEQLTIQHIRLLHAGMGLATEAGEFLDMLKKTMFYGAKMDEQNLIEEVGDVLWYVAEACNALDIDMGVVMAGNIVKLRKRYPDKFTGFNALSRDTEAEMVAMGKEIAK